MFNLIPKRLKKEYMIFIKSNAFAFAISIIIMLLSSVMPVFSFLSVINVTELMLSRFLPDFVVYKALLFSPLLLVLFLILGKVFDKLFDVCRKKLVIRADGHITKRLDALGKTAKSDETAYEVEKFSSCMKCFADLFDRSLILSRLILILISYAYLTLYVNPFAGIPYILCDVVMFIYAVKGKRWNHAKVFYNLTAVGYYVSSFVLVFLRVLRAGTMAGFISSFMFRKFVNETLIPEYTKYAMDTLRVKELSDLLNTEPCE